MRIRTLSLGLLIAGAALAAQTPLNFVTPDGNIEAHGPDGRLIFEVGPIYRFEILGSAGSKVHAAVHDQGLEFFAERLQGVAVPDPRNKKTLMLKSATVSGGVRVIKALGGDRTEMTGSAAKYSGSAAAGTLSLAGPVKFTDFSGAKNQSLVATGSSAIASLAPGGKKDIPVRTATVRGPVKIDATERNASGGTEIVHISGARLDIDNTVNPAKLTLSGSVRMDSPQYGHFTGSKVVLKLNERRQVVSIEGT